MLANCPLPTHISITGWVDPRAIVRLGLGQMKNTMTSLGIKPETFQLEAQCLNQLRYQIHHYKV
jgi:hypothetical protein